MIGKWVSLTLIDKTELEGLCHGVNSHFLTINVGGGDRVTLPWSAVLFIEWSDSNE